MTKIASNKEYTSYIYSPSSSLSFLFLSLRELLLLLFVSWRDCFLMKIFFFFFWFFFLFFSFAGDQNQNKQNNIPTNENVRRCVTFFFRLKIVVLFWKNHLKKKMVAKEFSWTASFLILFRREEKKKKKKMVEEKMAK